jgi:hypothetical protein
MGKRESIIKRARLREPEQKDSRRIGGIFIDEKLYQIQQRLVMNSYRLFRPKV